MKKNSFKFFAIAGALSLSSCSGGDILGGAPELSSKEGIKEITEIVKENFGEKDVFELSFSAEEHLQDDLGYIYASYVENDKTFTQSYTKTNSIGIGDPSEETTFVFKKTQNSLKKGSEFDFSFIPQKFEEAKKVLAELTDEYEDFVLYSFSVELDKDGKYTGDMTLEGTKKGEGTSMQGRNIVTNYYEFDFDINADGTVEYDE